MKIGPVLITGAGGQLGTDLALALQSMEVACERREDLDIADDAALEESFARVKPTLVLNCAAFHNVDECESQEATAAAVNVRAVKRIAELCKAGGAKLVHFSTNYVFDGRRAEPYGESDLPNPRSVYAITKLGGEHAAISYAPDALVVRTAGLYGTAGSASKGGNFVQRMLSRARAGEPIRMVADQRLSPTYTTDLATGVIAAVDAGVSGTLHLTNSGSCSWFAFTEAILAIAGVEAEIEAVGTQPRPGDADRPLNGVIVTERLAEPGVAEMRSWHAALADYMRAAGFAAPAQAS